MALGPNELPEISSDDKKLVEYLEGRIDLELKINHAQSEVNIHLTIPLNEKNSAQPNITETLEKRYENAGVDNKKWEKVEIKQSDDQESLNVFLKCIY